MEENGLFYENEKNIIFFLVTK